jgi:hypothetical protein
VDTPSGQEWFIHFQDRGLYGRICHLQPVSWHDGWPVIGINQDENGCGEPVFEMEKPVVGSDDAVSGSDSQGLQSSDDFPGGNIGLQWQWLGNHKDSFYGKTDLEDGLRLYALNPSGDREVTIWKSANVLTQKLIYPVFEAKVRLDASSLKDGERAGVSMTGGQYIAAFIERDGEEFFCKVVESEGGDADKKEVVRKELRLSDLCASSDIVDDENGAVLIHTIKNICFTMNFDCDADIDSRKLYFQNATCKDESRIPSLKMGIALGDGSNTALDVAYTPSDHTWVGAKIGIFALSSGSCDSEDPGIAERSEGDAGDSGAGYADFMSVVVTEK